MSGKSLSSTRIKTIEEKLAGRLTRITKERCMYKVHEQLRDVKQKAYEPVLLPIGPYNDPNKVGQGFMKEHKLRYLQQTLKGTKRSECIKALIGLEETALKCYADCISQSPDHFVETMLLDGCFIIELFCKYNRMYKERDEDDPIISIDHQSPEYEAKDQADEGDPIITTEKFPKYEVQDRIDEANPIISTDKQSTEFEAQDPTDGRDPISSSEQSPEYDPIFQMAWVLPTIARDLLLFENQLPYFVLVKLFEIMSGSNETRPRNGSRSSGEHIVGVEEIEEIGVESSTSVDLNIKTRLNVLALGFFSDFIPFKWDVNASSYNSSTTIKHLLRLKHEALTPSLPKLVCDRLRFGFRFKYAEFEHLLGLIHASISISILDTEIKRQGAGVKSKKAEIFKHDLFGPIRKAVSLLVEKMENTSKENSPANESKSEDLESSLLLPELHEARVELGTQGDGVESKSTEKLKAREIEHCNIHGATELKEAGIKFKAAKEDDWFSIKFKNGVMELSPMSIGDQTETHIRNLIAYEQYCDRDNGCFNYFTNYVRFMDSLISTPKDVELLRREGIIRNDMGDDVVISNMVNQLCDNIIISTSSFTYASTSMDVNMHCGRKMNKWMAKLRRDYFSSPWALISFLAAALLLGLTIVQTIFSIIP